MSVQLKPLAEQVVVITGASSGIGLATARRAARAGAKVVLVARNEAALREAAESIRVRGGKAIWSAIDIAAPEAAEHVGALAEQEFGGFDTWVNDAAVSVYAPLAEITSDEHRRIFDVGYFGLVEASLYAARKLEARGGGAIINLGSVLSDRAVPVQGAYSAMKHAVAGFTEALRTELESAGKPISVTLIKPHGIDTPYPEHARNKLDRPGRVPPVVYDPELVAKAICFAAAHPKRDLTVGGQGLLLEAMSGAMPWMMDRVIERFFNTEAQTIDTPPEPGAADNLFEPREDGRERSNQPIYVRKQSLALEAQMRPWTAAALVGGLGAAAAFAFFKLREAARTPPAASAHQPDGTDSSAQLAAGIADENMIPDALPTQAAERG